MTVLKLSVHKQSSYLSSIFLGLHREIDGSISRIHTAMHVVSLLPRSNPLRALCVQYLAKARYVRYKLTPKQDDLKQITLGFTEAIFLPLPQKLPPEAQNI